MTDDKTPLPASGSATEDSEPSRTGGSGRFLFALAFLVAALAAAYGLWRYAQQLRTTIAEQDAQLQQMAQGLNALEVQADRMERRQTDLASAGQRAANRIAEFENRIQAHDEQVGDLSEELSGGRARFQLVAIEQLLVLANDRLLLARDVESALAALDAADARLAQQRDPRLFAVRQALAQERTALRGVPVPDSTGAALTLSSLIARAPRLPLAARVADHFEAPPAAVAAQDEDRSAAQRFMGSVRQALASLFTVRRNAGPSPRLLSSEQETLIVEILMLKLEGARMALLRGDAVSFRDLCESARQWLTDYFRAQDPGVAAAQGELERLLPLNLAPPLPDIDGSLGLLRAQLEAPPQ
ncbi:MAG TPA: uroporphyrinogen-III C-methyltransferase [Solimonas sp.]